MYEQLEKPKENKSKAVAASVVQKKGNAKQGFGFVDNRPDRKKLLIASGGVLQAVKIPLGEHGEFDTESEGAVEKAKLFAPDVMRKLLDAIQSEKTHTPNMLEIADTGETKMAGAASTKTEELDELELMRLGLIQNLPALLKTKGAINGQISTSKSLTTHVLRFHFNTPKNKGSLSAEVHLHPADSGQKGAGFDYAFGKTIINILSINGQPFESKFEYNGKFVQNKIGIGVKSTDLHANNQTSMSRVPRDLSSDELEYCIKNPPDQSIDGEYGKQYTWEVSKNRAIHGAILKEKMYLTIKSYDVPTFPNFVAKSNLDTKDFIWLSMGQPLE